MPRRIPPPRKAYPALTALRLQSARREAVTARRDHHAREAALALRKATPDWVELEAQLKRYQLEAEIKRAQETSPRASPRESMASNENSPPPHPSHLGAKNWKYDSIAGGYDPADDWRNWE